MNFSRYIDSQILAILKQAEACTPVPTLCREHGMSSVSFYKRLAKFGGMDASMMKRMKELENENRHLKKMYQAHLPDLLRTGAESADKAQTTNTTKKACATGRA